MQDPQDEGILISWAFGLKKLLISHQMCLGNLKRKKILLFLFFPNEDEYRSFALVDSGWVGFISLLKPNSGKEHVLAACVFLIPGKHARPLLVGTMYVLKEFSPVVMDLHQDRRPHFGKCVARDTSW